MMKEPLFDDEELIKTVKKAIKEGDKIPEPYSVYIDKDGKIIRPRTKKKKVK